MPSLGSSEVYYIQESSVKSQIIKGLQYLTCEAKRSRIGEEKVQVNLINYMHTCRDGAKHREQGAFQWFSVIGREAVGTNWNAEDAILT